MVALVSPARRCQLMPLIHPPDGTDARASAWAFEGAGGSFTTGLFRPVLECRMNQNDPPWCPVCARKISAIYRCSYEHERGMARREAAAGHA